MPKLRGVLVLGMLVSGCASAPRPVATHSAPDGAPVISELRLDPLLLVSVREYRNVMRVLGSAIFPGWSADSIPLLLYRPGVQELLLNAPRRPPGFALFTGRTPLGAETIWARNDSTVMDLDDQNTTTELDSVRVVVVADRYSRERNQLRAMLGRTPEETGAWLDRWGFVQSPYDEVQLLLHEAFHVHQERHAPGRGADESLIARYPVLDARNNALVALEGLTLRDALLASDGAARRAHAEEFVAARRERRATLAPALATYEDLTEFSEGLGRYVELRFLQLAERVEPAQEMWLQPGFAGYGDATRARFQRRAEDLARIAANCDNRFGNRFGGGPVRFRSYEIGAAQALLLDELAPAWKTGIFAPSATIFAALDAALALDAAGARQALERAQRRHGYDSLLANRVALEGEGRRQIQARVDAIINTPGTLVIISYGSAGDALGLGYTPFGVTAVSDSVAIYDMVPIAARFANRVLLRLKTVTPVLIDRAARTVAFAVREPAASVTAVEGAIDVAGFSLTGSPGTRVVVEGNRVMISLR